MKPKLVTVTGHRTNTLRHQLNHYKDKVSDAFIVVYENADSPKNLADEIKEITKEFGLGIHSVKTHRPFDWGEVTNQYNITKNLFPDDWWLVADDDELQVYWKDIEDIIAECEENHWKYVSGGFVDRIGATGNFPEIERDSNLWKLFPVAGFFRYPMSGACPNKVTLCKGNIELTSGQHYIRENNKNIYGPTGWNHPWRYPIRQNFVQVHHFKWDSTVLDRLIAIAKVNKDYSYSNEYKRMYEMIAKSGFKININDTNLFCQFSPEPNYEDYKFWRKLTNIILHI
jgi:hypothetical protein